MNQLHSFFIVAATSLMTWSASAQIKGEPYEEALRESLKQYKAGNMAAANAALDQAKGILEKNKTAQIGQALPDPPNGWVADEMKTEDVGPFLGGGKVVRKLYKNSSGQQQVQLEVFYGSSLIRLMRGMLANEGIAKAQGYSIKRAGGEKVLVKRIDAKNHEVNLPMDDEILIRLTGREGAEEELMIKMLRDVDRREIKSLIKPKK
jgi:hypothetical protein